MATINVELTDRPRNISRNLEDDVFYTVQSFGGSAQYILVEGNAFPAEPPKRAHLLRNNDHVQLRVAAAQSIWAWSGNASVVLVITDAASVKAI